MKKKLSLALAGISLAAFISCANNSDESSNILSSIDYESKKASYGELIVKGGKYEQENGVITLGAADDSEKGFEVSGYFKGQIKNTIKGTIIKLSNVYIENDGKAAIYGALKTEISAKEGTENYLITTGSSKDKIAAVQCEKKLEFGGKGSCYIVGNIIHGIKCDEAEFKGNGNYYIQGTKDGSCINCNEFSIDADKSVNITLINSKNGIKADKSITIKSGTISLNNLDIGLKTDLKESDSKEHFISLSNCTINHENVNTLFSTDENALTEENVKR